MTAKYLYTTIAHKQKRVKKIPSYLLKILTCSIILMPSNSLALELYEHGISKHTFSTLQAFAVLEKKEDVYREKTIFATAKKVWSLSSMWRESSSSQNRKAGHTHTHTQDDCYTLATNAYARVTIVITPRGSKAYIPKQTQ